MLDEAPPLCVHIDIISLSIFDDVPIVFPSDTDVGGEVDIAFLIFSCFGLRVKFISKCISPGWSKPEGSPLAWIYIMGSSYNKLKLFFAFDTECSSRNLFRSYTAWLVRIAPSTYYRSWFPTLKFS